MKLPKDSFMDDRLISREFYNANPFPITFKLQKRKLIYLVTCRKTNNPEIIVCKPLDWAFLPHAYYTASWPDGRLADEVIAHFNYGDNMFKGKKPNKNTLRKARLHING